MSIDPRLLQPPGDVPLIYSTVSDLDRRVRMLENVRSTIGAGTITGGTGGMVGTGTITGGNVSAGTITGTNLVAGTITATQIQAGSITSTLIAADAINAGHIQAGAVTASEIAANTITAAQIAANTITSTEIFANTITAADIAASTITAAQIAASTITATQIATGTITGSLIAGATITGSNLVAGTITATQIGVSQLSAISANMGTLTAGTITGATFQSSASNPRVWIDSTGLKATNAAGEITLFADASIGRITALAGIGGVNMLKRTDGESTDWATYWTGGSGRTLAQSSTQWKYGTKSISVTPTSTVAPAYFSVDALVPAKSSTVYTISAWVYATSATPRTLTFMISSQTAAGGANANQFPNGVPFTPVQNQWTRIVATFTTLADVKNVTPYLHFNTSTDLNIIYVDGVQLEEGYVVTSWGRNPEEIYPSEVSGGNGADHILPGSIIGSDLLANTITATQIQAATITGTQIAAVTVTAGNIVSGTITATQIAAGTITADRMNVTSLSAITANLGTITAGTITGATLQTATSGSRVVVDVNGLKAFNTTNETLRIASADGSTAMTLPDQVGSLSATQPTNPSATVDASNWTTVTRNTSIFRSSPASFALASGGLGTCTGWTFTGVGSIYFGAGTRYQFVAWVRTNAGVANENVVFNMGLTSLTGPPDEGGTRWSIRGGRVDTTWRRFTVEWVPQIGRISSNTPNLYFQNLTNQTLYIDDVEVRVLDVPIVRSFNFTDAPGGNRRGALYGWQEEFQDNTSMALSAEPAAGELDRASSVRLQVQPGGLTPEATLSVNYDPTRLEGQRSLVFEMVRDGTGSTGVGTLGRWNTTILDSTMHSDFMLAVGEHVRVFQGGISVVNGGSGTVAWGGTDYNVTANLIGTNTVGDMFVPGAPTRVTANRAGIYICSINANAVGGGFGWQVVINRWNAAGTYLNDVAHMQQINEPWSSATGMTKMDVGDYITVTYANNTGATHTLVVHFEMSRIGSFSL